jgi:hypothetical protein
VMYPKIPNKDFDPSFRPKCTSSQVTKILFFFELSRDSHFNSGRPLACSCRIKIFFQHCYSPKANFLLVFY